MVQTIINKTIICQLLVMYCSQSIPDDKDVDDGVVFSEAAGKELLFTSNY